MPDEIELTLQQYKNQVRKCLNIGRQNIKWDEQRRQYYAISTPGEKEILDILRNKAY